MIITSVKVYAVEVRHLCYVYPWGNSHVIPLNMFLGNNFIVLSILCFSRKSGFREELYFRIRVQGQPKIKDLRPLQGRTLLFVNTLFVDGK